MNRVGTEDNSWKIMPGGMKNDLGFDIRLTGRGPMHYFHIKVNFLSQGQFFTQ